MAAIRTRLPAAMLTTSRVHRNNPPLARGSIGSRWSQARVVNESGLASMARKCGNLRPVLIGR